MGLHDKIYQAVNGQRPTFSKACQITFCLGLFEHLDTRPCYAGIVLMHLVPVLRSSYFKYQLQGVHNTAQHVTATHSPVQPLIRL